MPGSGAATVVGVTTGSAVCARSCRAAETSSATVVDEVVMLCVTGPSSPGLSTRTEIVVLHPEQVLGSTGAADGADTQLQFQFHVHCADDDGVIELVPVELSEQFQFQFQTQVVGAEEVGVSTESSDPDLTDEDKSEAELVLPVLPP